MTQLKLMKATLIALIAGLPLMFATSPSAAAEDAQQPYPLDTCVVSGEKLGEMGDPYVFTHEGREVRLCCKQCLKKFNQDPEKYLKKLENKGGAPAKDDHEGH